MTKEISEHKMIVDYQIQVRFEKDSYKPQTFKESIDLGAEINRLLNNIQEAIKLFNLTSKSEYKIGYWKIEPKEDKCKMRRLIYLEDQHGHTPPYKILFKTDCEWPVAQLEELSWKEAGAGRMATGFNEFKKLLEKEGFKVEKITYALPGRPMISQGMVIEGLEEVRGATGNY